LRPLLYEGLTRKESRVLELRQIVHERARAEKTAKNYVSMVLSKLGFENRAPAAPYIAQVEYQRQRPRP
jgi:DNA-binding NarL/FixJ family response regulator